MSEGREESLWDHTAAIRETIANASQNRTKRGYSYDQFHPFATRRRRREGPTGDINVLRAMAPKGKRS